MITGVVVLVVVGLFQLAFIILLLVFLGVRREIDRARKSAFEGKRLEVSEPLSSWLTGSDGPERFVASVRAFPGMTALTFTGNLVRTTIPRAERDVLGKALRDEPWIERALSGASSRRWGRRLDAARALALVGRPDDRAMLTSLLNDSRPVVAVAAVSALPRIADASFVDDLLQRFIVLPDVVRMYAQDTLNEMRDLVEPALMKRLQTVALPRALARWIELAGALGLPGALDRAALLSDHSDAGVRGAVARALRKIPSQHSADVLALLLRDEEAEVRALAAHSLGELASPAAIPALVEAAHDRSWVVRYRAMLAIAQLGEQGRTAVRALRSDSDRYVVDMATLIAGLGDGALFELEEA